MEPQIPTFFLILNVPIPRVIVDVESNAQKAREENRSISNQKKNLLTRLEKERKEEVVCLLCKIAPLRCKLFTNTTQVSRKWVTQGIKSLRPFYVRSIDIG